MCLYSEPASEASKLCSCTGSCTQKGPTLHSFNIMLLGSWNFLQYLEKSILHFNFAFNAARYVADPDSIS